MFMPLNDESTPQKKKKLRARKKENPVSLSSKHDEVTTPGQLERAITQAFKRFYAASISKQNKIKDLHHLDSIVAEYLQSFIILGYDLNGEKICISHASTPAARDALVEHMRTTFLNIINNNGGE
jgi:hypothetical protein